MARDSSTTSTETARSTTRTPPAWLITASMFVFAVVTIVLVLTGQ
jgi:hypothetical protein